MLIGTSCRLSERFCAVTITSPRTLVSCAISAGLASASRTADATGVRDRKVCGRFGRTTGIVLLQWGSSCGRDYD